MRKLASIQKIESIHPIPEADNIEAATVNGWTVVVKKGEFSPNDYCVYCEVDSFLPISPKYEFLRKSSYKKMGDIEGFRLKTVKLRGVISQGLILPTSVLSTTNYVYNDMPCVGDDVTELLGIVKYEPPIPAELAGVVKGPFPSFIPRTDEERIQNLTKEFEELRRESYYVTEKLDGTSATFYYNNGEFGVCSRNWELEEAATNTYWKIANELRLKDRLAELDRNIAIQGEIIGEGIQGNKYKIKGHKFYLFNVYSITHATKVSLPLMHMVRDALELESVPLLTVEFILPKTIAEVLAYAEGKSQLNAQIEREGVVIRSTDSKISFKAISNKFLLKHGD